MLKRKAYVFAEVLGFDNNWNLWQDTFAKDLEITLR